LSRGEGGVERRGADSSPDGNGERGDGVPPSDDEQLQPFRWRERLALTAPANVGSVASL
jgi:hypothetical protein